MLTYRLHGEKGFIMEEIRNITLTKKQLSTITALISMTENYRADQIRKWEELTGRTELDGTLTAPNAEMYATYLKNEEKELKEITRIINKAKLNNPLP